MMRAAWCLLVVLLLGAARGSVQAPVADADAVEPQSTRALFARSCADCPSSHEFCEFGYPGTPEDHVACVAYGESHRLLYRSYDSCSVNLIASKAYCSGTAIRDGYNATAGTGSAVSADCVSYCRGVSAGAIWWVSEDGYCACYASLAACDVGSPDPSETRIYELTNC